MGRYDLQHVDKGIIYLPISNDMNDTDINNIIQENQQSGKTIVLFRSGKYNMKNILKELIKAKLDA